MNMRAQDNYLLLSRYSNENFDQAVVIYFYPESHLVLPHTQAFVGQMSRSSCIPIKWIQEAMEPNADLYFPPSPPLSTLALKTTSSQK